MSQINTVSESLQSVTAASLPPLSPPAQKPASVSGDSGAGLVGNLSSRVIPGSVVKISLDRYSRVNLCFAHLTKPSGFWFRHCDVSSRYGEFLGRRTS